MGLAWRLCLVFSDGWVLLQVSDGVCRGGECSDGAPCCGDGCCQQPGPHLRRGDGERKPGVVQIWETRAYSMMIKSVYSGGWTAWAKILALLLSSVTLGKLLGL